MRKLLIFACLVIAVPVFSHRAFAQEAKAAASEAHYYHLEFVVKELGEDGKAVNSRVFHTDIMAHNDVAPDSLSSVRAGTRIPVPVSSKDGDVQVQYIDVGVNIDCNKAHETSQGLGLQITVEISSPATPGAATPTTPIIRQNKWTAATVLPLGKPTIVFSSDNLENKGRMQVEVTATPVR